jgi:hypothetical protein
MDHLDVAVPGRGEAARRALPHPVRPRLSSCRSWTDSTGLPAIAARGADAIGGDVNDDDRAETMEGIGAYRHTDVSAKTRSRRCSPAQRGASGSWM